MSESSGSTAERLQSGLALHKKGSLLEARRIYLEVLAEQPDNADALHLAGLVAYQQGDYREALERIGAAIQRRPDVAKYHSNHGNALKAVGDLAGAIRAYRHAIEIDPGFADAPFNLGVALRESGNPEAAASAFQAALRINPANVDAKQNLAAALRLLNLTKEAIPLFRDVLRVRPNVPEIHFNFSQALEHAGHLREAMAEARAALGLSPNYGAAAAALYSLLRQTCAWDGLAEAEKVIEADITSTGPQARPAETPFFNIVRSDNGAGNLAVARSWGRALEQAAPLAAGARREPRFSGRLHVGYLSSDMRNHAMGHLMRGLFGRHDRQRFHITMFSCGKDDDSRYRRDIAKGCDAFIDVRKLASEETARRIHFEAVDILVDLNGWTGGHRLAACAFRPAPIQVTYLGYPGTTGCRFIDYAIVDAVVAGPDRAHNFSEALVWMPNCYQVNDCEQPISNADVRREDVGLPIDGVVFCSFVAHYKIEPVMFDVWMRLLQQVPGSVLWLLDANEMVTANLRAAAESRGVSADRLVFASKLPKDEHLRRMQLADLAIDTRIYNGHTTTSDALWAGVPVVTTAGRHFASRVSASCLKSVGLPELITADLESFEVLALHLARHPNELRRLRERLATQRLTRPLFDTGAFARQIDWAFNAMWRRYEAGQSPQSFTVPLTP